MKETKTQKVLNGEKIYPYMNGKVIRINAIYNNESKDNNIFLISDKTGEKIYVVSLLSKEDKDYTLRLVEKYCDMNRESFFEDYVDIFGNKIWFK